jgi:hypothetical protein
MIDVERFHEIGRLRDYAGIESVEAHLQRPRLDPRTIENILIELNIRSVIGIKIS